MSHIAIRTGLLLLATLLHSTLSAQQSAARAPPTGESGARTAWGDPDLEGMWTNATLTPLQRPPELAAKEFFTPDEAAQFQRTRIEQTSADRSLPPGQVGAYNDAFFERGTSIVRSRRTSLVVDPPDRRIPALTPDAQKTVEALHPLRCEGADVAGGVQQQLPHHPELSRRQLRDGQHPLRPPGGRTTARR